MAKKAVGVSMRQAIEAVLTVRFPGKHVLVVHAEHGYDEECTIDSNAVQAYLREHVQFHEKVSDYCHSLFMVIELSAEEARVMARDFYSKRPPVPMDVYSHGVLVGSFRWDHGQTVEEAAEFEKNRVHLVKADLFCACGRNFWHSVKGLADLRKHERVCPKTAAEAEAG